MTLWRWVAAFWWAVLVVTAIGGPWLFHDAAIETDVSALLAPPSRLHWFGTDSLGRDFLARLIMGTRVSLVVGLGSAVLCIFIGLIYGALSGWLGGWVDRLAQRFTDVILAVPRLILAATLGAGFEVMASRGTWEPPPHVPLILAIALTHWMTVARVTRGLVRQARVLPLIEATRALGASDRLILWRHVLPRLRGPLFILFSLQIPANILYESVLSFIGIGVRPPLTSWGLLVQEGWKLLTTAPHLILFPAGVLFLTVWSVHVLFESAERWTRDSSVL